MPDDSTPEEPTPPNDPAPQRSGLGAFWAELKRRKVMRVASVYLAVGWLVVQLANAPLKNRDRRLSS